MEIKKGFGIRTSKMSKEELEVSLYGVDVIDKEKILNIINDNRKYIGRSFSLSGWNNYSVLGLDDEEINELDSFPDMFRPYYIFEKFNGVELVISEVEAFKVEYKNHEFTVGCFRANINGKDYSFPIFHTKGSLLEDTTLEDSCKSILKLVKKINK